MIIFNNAKEKSKDIFNKSYENILNKKNVFKDKINFKIRKKAILSTKAKLAQENKTFEDYNDEELEIIIAHEENKITDSFKSNAITGVLVLLGLDLLV